MAQATSGKNPVPATTDRLGLSPSVYVGRVYAEQTYLMNGSPYLASDSMSSGWIVYDGQFFPDVKLQWDVFQNFVLIRALNGYSKIILRNELIDSFHFAGHTVRQMEANRDQNLSVGGLYDILYEGKIAFIARRKKENMANLDGRRVVYHFRDKSILYVKKDEVYYRVSNRRDVLRLFSSQAAGIKRDVRRAGLRWKKDFEQALLVSVMHYDKAN